MMEKVKSFLQTLRMSRFWQESESWEMIIKRIIYIVGFAGLVIIDLIIGSQDGYIQNGYKNYTGVVIGLVILTAYGLKDFIKIPYAIWAVVFFIGRAIVMNNAELEQPEYICWQYNTMSWVIGVYGLVVIRMVYLYVIERQKPKMNWPMFGVWLFMMLWMVFVQPETKWQLLMLLFFAPFYLTNFKEKDLNNLYAGLAEGIIVGFLIVQGQALMHRPYDTVRYMGMYANENINALFYAFSYCATLCKWYQMKLRRRHVLLRVPFILLAGCMVALTFFTGGRTALITMALISVIFLVFQALARKKRKLLELLIDVVVLGGAIVLCFVPTYKLVRYVPAWVDEPIYVVLENVEAKVQQGDPIDSEKYVEFGEMLKGTFGRVLWFQEKEEEETSDEVSRIDADWKWLLGPALQVQAAGSIEVPEEWYDVYWYPEDTMFMEPGIDNRHPILLPEEYDDPVKVRMAIYEYYFKELNLTGEHEYTLGPWITSGYQAPHAHNVFLQMAYEFGWPVGVLMIAIAFLLYNKAVFGIVERRSGAWYYRLFVTLGFATVLVAFGMLEQNWKYGQLPLTMFFLVQYLLYHKSEMSKKTIENR